MTINQTLDRPAGKLTATETRRPYGAGSLFERPGTEAWYGKWYCNGRHVQRKVGRKAGLGKLTKRQAEERLREMIRESKENGVQRAPAERLTTEEIGRRYVAHLQRMGRKRSTVTAVESALRIWINPFFAAKSISSITHNDVEDLMHMMEAGSRPGQRTKGDRRYGRVPSAKSIRNYLGILSALFNFAKAPKRKWISANPCEGLELPAVARYDGVRFLEVEQIDALLEGVPVSDYRALDCAIYRTAAMTGLRLGELIALRWRDVDWTAKAIRVRSNYVLGEFDTPKSRLSARNVPMADEVAGVLDRYFKQRGEPADHALVFGDPLATDGPLDKAAVLRRLREALKAANLDPTHRFHDLRHTFGTVMAASGVPMRTLQEWMGHSDISTTERYAAYMPRDHEADLVAAAFSRGHVSGHILSESETTPENVNRSSKPKTT